LPGLDISGIMGPSLENALERSGIQGSDQADVGGLTEEIIAQQAVGVPLRQQGHLPWRASGCLFCLDCSKERAPAVGAEATENRAEKADTETTRPTCSMPSRGEGIKTMDAKELIRRYGAGERDFPGSDLRGANLHEANLHEANLSNANLQGASLGAAVLSAATLFWANLTRADLHGADLHGARLRAANLSGVVLSEATLFWVNLARADLRGADLRGARLHEADLEGANLEWANLEWADLKGASLSEANLEWANLSGANVTDEQLAQAKSLKGATIPDGTKHE
jgi:uncharacterized protein YjbI with pentapeptide repeats